MDTETVLEKDKMPTLQLSLGVVAFKSSSY